ncbi:hypothetical protein, partial [Escherichia coli]|uniref:hypothetical protein n=1 Tax=Escherichia coli TaxID=562 RepID=UPI003754C311
KAKTRGQQILQQSRWIQEICVFYITQKRDESAADYGLRVEILNNRLHNIYDSDRSLDSWRKDSYKREADAEALEQFLLGLNGGAL